jgi:hypothetical protein
MRVHARQVTARLTPRQHRAAHHELELCVSLCVVSVAAWLLLDIRPLLALCSSRLLVLLLGGTLEGEQRVERSSSRQQ